MLQNIILQSEPLPPKTEPIPEIPSGAEINLPDTSCKNMQTKHILLFLVGLVVGKYIIK